MSANAGWMSVARDLFKMLDNIDTIDDIAKGDEALYRNLVRKEHEKRFKYQWLFDPDADVSTFNQPPQQS